MIISISFDRSTCLLYLDSNLSVSSSDAESRTDVSSCVTSKIPDGFKADMTETEALKLAARALHASGQRDAASGNGMDLAVITKKDGFVLQTEDQVRKLLS